MPYMGTRRTLLGGDSALRAPVPELGAELLVDGGLENWTTPTNATNWFEALNGTTTINQESTVVHGGTYAARIDVDASNSSFTLRASPTLAAETFVQVGYWLRANQASKTASAYLGAVLIGTHTLSNGTWTQYFFVVRSAAANPTLDFGRVSLASTSMYVDDVTLKAITLASMFSTRAYSTHAATKAAVTLVAGTRAGVVCNLDSATSPANFVIANHNGTNAMLTKCVSGTYTSLIDTAVAYVAGAYVEVRREAGTNDYELYYAGTKVGATQTIADAGITGNVLHGYMNTYAGNVVAGFVCSPS